MKNIQKQNDMATLKYIGILPTSLVKPNYHTKFVYDEIVHGKRVEYYECVVIEGLHREFKNVNTSLVRNLTISCKLEQDLFENPYN